jgi:hypothetical protein
MNNSWISVARDVAIVLFLTFIGGVIIGVAGGGRDLSMTALAISNLLLGSIGFCIAGCLTRVDRWKHLLVVALIVWLFGLVNVAFFHVNLVQWLFSSIAVLLMMAIGGGLSFLFVKETPPAPPAV